LIEPIYSKKEEIFKSVWENLEPDTIIEAGEALRAVIVVLCDTVRVEELNI